MPQVVGIAAPADLLFGAERFPRFEYQLVTADPRAPEIARLAVSRTSSAAHSARPRAVSSTRPSSRTLDPQEVPQPASDAIVAIRSTFTPIPSTTAGRILPGHQKMPGTRNPPSPTGQLAVP